MGLRPYFCPVSKDKGNKGEIYFINWCIQNNMHVSLPYGSGEEYDIILDNQGKLYRVQIKTVHDRLLRPNGYHIDISTKARQKYVNVELFAICFYKTGFIYLIPAKDIRTKYLSLNPYSNRSKYNKYLVNGVPDYI